MLVIKKGKELVEQDVVISKKHLCDKCGIEITRDSYNDEFECKLTYITGENMSNGGSGRITLQEVELCKKCASELIGQLKLLDYSVVTTECDHLDWMIRKPSYNAVSEKLTLREINHD